MNKLALILFGAMGFMLWEFWNLYLKEKSLKERFEEELKRRDK